MRFAVEENEVFVDGVDISDCVVSIEITYETGEKLVRTRSEDASKLAKMLEAITMLAVTDKAR